MDNVINKLRKENKELKRHLDILVNNSETHEAYDIRLMYKKVELPKISEYTSVNSEITMQDFRGILDTLSKPREEHKWFMGLDQFNAINNYLIYNESERYELVD